MFKNKRLHTTNDLIYVRLQQHLDRQAVGFPATRSGAEIRILKHIFTPLEAQLATCLTYRFESLETVLNRAAHMVDAPEELEKHLDRILKKGGIESRLKNGQRQYCNSPLVVGMYEMQLERLTPEFIKDFREYTNDLKFGIEFLSTGLPQMRTIPVARSLRVEHQVRTYDEVTALLDEAASPFVILECICRKKKALTGDPCKVTDRKETCLAMGTMAQSVLHSGFGREIPRAEAMAIIEENQKQGLVLQPSNSEKIEFICSCCGCCCGMLNIHKSLPKPLDYWASNFQARVDPAACTGCGICARRCPVEAVGVSARKQPAIVNPERCLGCGVCVSTCPEKAISLFKKTQETRPPKTREALHDIIMTHKKGPLGKLKLTGKLLTDAIFTGHRTLK